MEVFEEGGAALCGYHISAAVRLRNALCRCPVVAVVVFDELLCVTLKLGGLYCAPPPSVVSMLFVVCTCVLGFSMVSQEGSVVPCTGGQVGAPHNIPTVPDNVPKQS